MKRSLLWSAWAAAAVLLLGSGGANARWTQVLAPAAVGTAFTYQGRLTGPGGPVNGVCDLQFTLWDSAANLSGQVGPTLAMPATLTAGLFTVQLDFGPSAFTGDARWLQTAVRCPSGVGGSTTLWPRQALNPAPYAMFSANAGGLHGTDVLPALPVAGQVLTFDGSAWLPAAPAGDITSVGAGPGLTGGGLGGSVTLTVVFSGTGSSPEAARVDHNHWGQHWIGTSQGLWLEALPPSDGATGLLAYSRASIGTGVQGVVAPGSTTSGMLVPTAVSGINSLPAAGGLFTPYTFGVFGQAYAWQGIGVYGTATYTGVAGVADQSATNAVGVYGEALGSMGTGVIGNGAYQGGYMKGPNYGLSASGYSAVYAESPSSNGNGIIGVANNGSNAYGVWGQSGSGFAGYFNGKVYVSGNFSVGGTKSFFIDNPLNPEKEYLVHYAIEAPQAQNVYNGTAILDTKGRAVVALPAYFSSANAGEFRYALTAIGAPMPQLHIAEEITGNTFTIGGGEPGKKVSWVVYANRNDPWVRDHPQGDVLAKPDAEVGTYLYPEGYGQTALRSVEAVRKPTPVITVTAPARAPLTWTRVGP